VPSFVTDGKEGITALNIQAQAVVLASDDQMLLTLSMKGLPNSGSKRGLPGWKKGQTLRLSSSESNRDLWCTNCSMYLLVDVQESGGLYSIVAKTNRALGVL